jgi:hypothetical protein
MAKGRRSTIVVVLTLVAVALGALGFGVLPYLNQTPAPFGFTDAKARIPGSMVTSSSVALDGFRGRLPVAIHGEGAVLVINGQPAKPGQAVKAGDRLAVQLTVGDFGERREAMVTIRDTTALFAVESLSNRPSAILAFKPLKVPAGRIAFSNFVAPEGFLFGTRLIASSDRLRVVTKSTKDFAPMAMIPGEVFQLAHPSPERPGDSVTVQISIGELTAQWTITAS